MSRVIAATGTPPPLAALEEATGALRAGLVVGIPTDTVYGLAAEPSRPGATRRLFDLKARPQSVALPVLVADVAQALALAVADRMAVALMERWWPGALTLVLARRPSPWFADLGGDGETIGLRCPAHPVPLALAAAVGPLATTSANRHGGAPLETAQELSAELGPGVAVILDGGRCSGSPSTVVDCTGVEPGCLREGSIRWAEVVASLGR